VHRANVEYFGVGPVLALARQHLFDIGAKAGDLTKMLPSGDHRLLACAGASEDVSILLSIPNV